MNAFDARTRQQVDDVIEISKTIIGSPMKAAYLFGSAVAGGLKRDSDLDIFIIADRNLSEYEKKQLIEAFMKISGKIGNQENKRYLEITVVNEMDLSPWQYPPKQNLLYGEWLREHFEKGYIPGKDNNPDLVLILKQLLHSHHILYGEAPEKFIPEIPHRDVKQAVRDTLTDLTENYVGDERNTILTLCRMMVTVKTGAVLSKDEAAKKIMENIPEEHYHLIEKACLSYVGEYDDKESYNIGEMTSLVDYLKSSIEKE